MNRKTIARAMGALTVLGTMLAATPAGASAEAVLHGKCTACHVEQDGVFSRISNQRKTPEGWLMSVARMQVMHGLKITDEERRSVVKYLADTQGLAPSETAGFRYALERRLNTPESFESEQFAQMCARCHSGARVRLQRRAPEDWQRLVHFHLGQFATTEYQMWGRDRDWFTVALDEVAPGLARSQPLDTEAWKAWRASTPPAVDGQWTVSGQMPGRGGFSGVMTVSTLAGKDRHAVSFEGAWDDGSALKGQGQAVVYTGYEWRADLQLDGTPMRQVLAVEPGLMRGRMFQRDHDEVGADIVASRQQAGNSRVLSVYPAYLKVGQEAELRIVGTELAGDVRLAEGIELLGVARRSATEVVVRVRAGASARGVAPVTVGQASGGALAVFERIDAVRVVPEFAVARIGGNGTPTAKVEGRFDAEAWAAGADGQIGTADDYRIGVFPARWSVAPFDEQAERDKDVQFAGVMDADSGVFVPGGAGPNPARRMMTNNAGNLKVLAEVGQGAEVVRGEGHLIVTVPRWNNPPIP
ncbi:MAG: quinohemoprotein amine dehydrogenase subunit alpha [Rhodocyclaceae bacterium]|nr:quinohemoprotein amine dehydrogenase subunit alpha [Rhodocyclaceae bacterium]